MSCSRSTSDVPVEPGDEHLAEGADVHRRRDRADVLARGRGAAPGGGVGHDERRQIVTGGDATPVERLAAERLDVQHPTAPAVVVDEPDRRPDGGPHLRRQLGRCGVESGDSAWRSSSTHLVVHGDDERRRDRRSSRRSSGGSAAAEWHTARTVVPDQPSVPSRPKAASSSTAGGWPGGRRRTPRPTGHVAVVPPALARPVNVPYGRRLATPVARQGGKGARAHDRAPTASSSTSSRTGEPEPRSRSSSSTGSPSSSYSWRHQMPALAAAGYHVIAPDQRGYGRSTRPEAHRGLRHRPPDRRPARPPRRPRRGAGRVRRPRLGRDGRVAARRSCTPSGSPASSGMSVPFIPRGADAADRS